MKTMFDILAPLYNRFSKLLFSEVRDDIIKKMDFEPKYKILDVGGGTGAFLEKILQREPEIQVVLLDSSKSMIEESKITDSMVQGKACRNPFSKNSFDYVLCTDALHHFEHKRKSVQEMMRVVKPGGSIIIFDMDAKSPVTQLIKLGEKILGEPSEFFTPEELSSFFDDHFDINIEKINSYEYILKSKKRLKSSY